MSDTTMINLVGCLVWMLIGAAVLSATQRGLLDVAESVDKDASTKHAMLAQLGTVGTAIVLILVWLIGCLLWPYTLLRFFQRHGLINGHTSKNCPQRILVKEHDDKTRNLYKHGKCQRR